MKIIRIVKCVHPIDDIIKNIFENLPQMRTWNKYDITGVRSIYIKKKNAFQIFLKKCNTTVIIIDTYIIHSILCQPMETF